MDPLLGMKPIAERDWVSLPGFPGLQQIVLSGSLDEPRLSGRRLRLVRFEPGMKTSTTLVHEYYEETYLVSGSLQVVGSPDSRLTSPAFALRPPGTKHGPFESDDGCVMLEIHYFA
jgi:hypothetical protein